MKKSILTIVGILAANLALFATDGNTLTVVVKNIQNTDGQVLITLFDSPENWLNEGQSKASIITVGKEVTFVFENIPNGEYGLSVIHDANNSNGLDTGIFGIPTEDYGFSNDARGQFGPAKFEESKVIVDGDITIEINVK